MLQSEYKDEEAKWIKFNDLAADIVGIVESKSFCQQVVQNIEELNKRWKNFGLNINERSKSLKIIKELGNEFENLQINIKYFFKFF